LQNYNIIGGLSRVFPIFFQNHPKKSLYMCAHVRTGERVIKPFFLVFFFLLIGGAGGIFFFFLYFLFGFFGVLPWFFEF